MIAPKILKPFMALIAMSALIMPWSPAVAEDQFDVFAASDETNSQTVSYEKIEEFLDIYAVKRGERLNLSYSAMRPQGLAFLNGYQAGLGRISPTTLSRNEQLAYWLNLRNIMIIRAIADEQPRRSLKKARGDAGEPGEMWTRKRLSIEGVSLSINDVEQNIILRQFDDPNIVYGLYQGVQGGPALHGKGFQGATIAEDLQALGTEYVNQKGVISVRKDEVRVPLTYHWYKDALFNGDDSKVIEHIASLASSGLQTKVSSASSLGQQKFRYSLDEHQIRTQRTTSPSSLPSRTSGPIGS